MNYHHQLLQLRIIYYLSNDITLLLLTAVIAIIRLLLLLHYVHVCAVIRVGYFTRFNMTRFSSLKLSNLFYYVAGECFVRCGRILSYFLKERVRT